MMSNADKQTTLLLNCDMGESLGPWSMGMDEDIMPLVDMANVACGFHASDAVTMSHTVLMAKKAGTRIGAHPAYPDLVGFGRRSMHCSPIEITAMVRYQMGALRAICEAHETSLDYVKPHGALYNDMHANKDILRAVMEALSTDPHNLPLMVLSQADRRPLQSVADEFGVSLIFEAFADRRYDDNGQLMPRTETGAVLKDTAAILAQVQQLLSDGSVTTASGKRLQLNPDTVCVHGDNAESVQAIQQIRQMLDKTRAAG